MYCITGVIVLVADGHYVDLLVGLALSSGPKIVPEVLIIQD